MGNTNQAGGEEIKCICGRSRDGICHCCCENQQPISYEEYDDNYTEEYDDTYNDFG